MNLISIRDRAIQRQQAVHQNRTFHRERQKECERDDHALNGIIRDCGALLSAQAALAKRFAEASPILLEAIGASETSSSAVPSVPADAPDTPVKQSADAYQPVADLADDPTVAPAELTTPVALIVHRHANIAEPLPKNFTDRVMAGLERERCGSTAAIDWIDLATATGASVPRVRKAVDKLAQAGRIRIAKSAVPGQVSVIFKGVREAAE